MAVINSYKDLTVWQKSMDLCQAIYKLTTNLPPDEKYGLASQMRRAAVSIPSNIAEGQRRRHRTEYTHFISIAYSSASELETQLLISQRIGYFEMSSISETSQLLEEVLKMLNKLVSSLQPTT